MSADLFRCYDTFCIIIASPRAIIRAWGGGSTRVTLELEMSESASLPGEVLQTFWDLASEEEAERLQAASRLVTYLREQQGDQKEQPCNELRYALERLVKGMASHRKMARSGYFITLTEVLQLPSATMPQVMELVNKHLEISKAKSKEERGVYFGRLFVFLSLIEAGKVKAEDEVIEVIKGLQACCKKSYLNEFCAVAMCKLIESCSEDLVSSKVIQLLELEGGWDTCTPHQLYILLSLNRTWGKTKWWKKLVKAHWSNFLKEKSYPRMATVLAESTSSHPCVHSVWPLVLEAVRAKKRLAPFWKTVVEDGLMISSHDRKYLGFKLLESLLPSLECSEVSAVFTTNLVQCWMNNVGSGANYLHAAAKHLLTVLMNYLHTARPALTASILLHLQSSTGNRFEQFIGNKALVAILSEMDLAGISEYLDKLKEMFCDPLPVVDCEQRNSGSQFAYNFSVQLWAADQIANLVRNRKIQRVESWLLNAAHFLFAQSFFDLSKPYETTADVFSVLQNPMSKATQDSCKQKFDTVLAELCAFVTTTKTDDGRKFSLPGTMQDGGYFASAIVQFAAQLVSGGVEMAEPFSEEDKDAWEIAISQVNSLREKESGDLLNKAFLLLFSVLGIKLFFDRSKTGQSIQELKVCHSEMMQCRTKTPKRKAKEQAAPGWMDVLVDMLLGFLSEGTQLWRAVVDQVFRMVASHLTSSAMQLIVKVLEPQAKEELMKDDEGSEEEDGEEEEDGGEEEGNEVSAKKDEIEDLSDGEESSDGEDETEDAVDPALREDVKKALGAAAAKSDDDEDDLDDDAMMAVDEALAQAFKLHMKHRSQKKVKKEEDTSVIHFKLRVLDLVEVYLKREYSNPLTLDLVVPLYQLIQHLQSKPDYATFASRVVLVFKTKLCAIKKYPKVGVDSERVHSHLHTLVELLDKATPTSSPLATLGCMFLLKVLRGATVPPAVSPLTTRSGRKRKCNEETPAAPVSAGILNVAMVTEWFAEALQKFSTKKTCNIPIAFFNTYIERFPTLAILLKPHMVDVIDKAANHFKKTQLHELLHNLQNQTVEEKVPEDG